MPCRATIRVSPKSRPDRILLMDNIYVSRGAPFQRSLTVLATVISTRGGRARRARLRCEGNQRRARPADVKDVPGARSRPCTPSTRSSNSIRRCHRD